MLLSAYMSVRVINFIFILLHNICDKEKMPLKSEYKMAVIKSRTDE